jgi:hypothetical protein
MHLSSGRRIIYQGVQLARLRREEGQELTEVRAMQITISNKAVEHIQKKGGRAPVELICLSS